MRLRVFSSPRFADHVTPPGHPERLDRAAVLQAVAADLRAAGADVVEPRRATDDELLRVHDADYLDAAARDRRPGRGARSRHVHLAGNLRSGTAGGRGRRRGRGLRARDRARRARAGSGAAAGPPRRARAGDGLLPVQQRRRGRGARPGPRPDAGGDRRLRRAPRQRHAGRLLRGPVGPVRVVAPVSVLPGHRRRWRDRQRRRDAASR